LPSASRVGVTAATTGYAVSSIAAYRTAGLLLYTYAVHILVRGGGHDQRR